MKVKLIAIAALGKNREIGLNGDLPWDLPEEYQHYLSTVKGHHVLIGRKNFELNGGDVEGTRPIVLTRDRSYKHPKALIVHDLSEVLALDLEKIFVVGGAEIYKLALPHLSEFLWTEVDYSGPADTYFPDFHEYKWNKLKDESHPGWTFRHLVKA